MILKTKGLHELAPVASGQCRVRSADCFVRPPCRHRVGQMLSVRRDVPQPHATQWNVLHALAEVVILVEDGQVVAGE